MTKLAVLILCAATCLFAISIVYGQDEKTKRKSKPILKTVDVLRRGLLAIDRDMSLEGKIYKLALHPQKDGWLLIVTFLPERPSAEYIAVIKDSGQVTVTPGI